VGPSLTGHNPPSRLGKPSKREGGKGRGKKRKESSVSYIDVRRYVFGVFGLRQRAKICKGEERKKGEGGRGEAGGRGVAAFGLFIPQPTSTASASRESDHAKEGKEGRRREVRVGRKGKVRAMHFGKRICSSF